MPTPRPLIDPELDEAIRAHHAHLMGHDLSLEERRDRARALTDGRIIDGEISAGGTSAFVHDFALDGDEDLYVGMPVRINDGVSCVGAVVSGRDDVRGYWYFAVLP